MPEITNSTNRSTTFSRRQVLAGLGAAGIVTVVGTSPVGALRALIDPTASGNQVVVNVFLRGGADGLNIVVPHGDPDYYRLRSSIARQPADLHDLDGFFGLDKAFDPLLPLFRQGDLALIHAAGSHDPVRSHFAAMDNMDLAFGTTGWMQRVLLAEGAREPLSAVSVGSRTSPSLRGPASGMAFPRVRQLLNTGNQLGPARSALETMYQGADPLIQGATLGAFSSIDVLRGIDTTPDVTYPTGNAAARDLREAASLIKADIGVKMISINVGGWDHHSDEVNRMNQRGGQLAAALAAFSADLGAEGPRVMTVVMTEFGRTAAQNGSGGTDHGHGSIMMVMGGDLRSGGGGKVHLADQGWVGLAPEDLDRGRYLAVTADFRSVLAEVLDRHYGFTDLSSAFPGFSPDYLGLLDGGAPPPPPPPPPEPGRGSVAGAVRYLGGAPAAGVTVDLFTDSGDGQRGSWLGDTRTDATGAFRFDVESGDYVLTFIAPGDSQFTGGRRYVQPAVTIGAGQDVVGIDAELLSGGSAEASIGGRVVDGGGGVSAVAVDLFQAGADGSRGRWLAATASDGDGRYRFDVQPGCYVLTFIAPPDRSFTDGAVFYQPALCVEAGERVADVDARLR